MIKVFTAVVITALVAFIPIASAAEPDKAAIEKIVEEYIRNHPEVLMESLNTFQAKQQADQERAQLDNALKNPVVVPIGNSPVDGPKNAEITIVEFSDFQCPYCVRSQGTLKALKDKYKGRIKFVFKHLPLPMHSRAKPAALAAIAAGEQGKFWEMKSLLMQGMPQWSASNDNTLFVGYAKQLGLNITKFEAALKNPENDTLVDTDLALAQKVGARGTPTFFVNGVLVSGARDIGFFDQIITKTLAMKKK